jgi:hypothetical protein
VIMDELERRANIIARDRTELKRKREEAAGHEREEVTKKQVAAVLEKLEQVGAAGGAVEVPLSELCEDAIDFLEEHFEVLENGDQMVRIE